MKEQGATLVILTYNHEKYIEAALEGAFSQTYSPLEIIISDDCSTDSTYDIIQKAVSKYDGKHKVIVNKNEKNQGLANHVNILFDMAQFDIVITAAGDDISLPTRVERSVDLFQKYTNAQSISFAPITIDEKGNKSSKNEPVNAVQSPERFITVTDFLSGTEYKARGYSRAYRKNVMDFFGPLNDNVPAEDVILSFRALLTGGVVESCEKLVCYRVLGESLSSTIGLDKNIILFNEKYRLLDMVKNIPDSMVLELKENLITGFQAMYKILKLHQSKYPLILFILYILPDPFLKLSMKKSLFKSCCWLSIPHFFKKRFFKAYR
ncbi:glycosyltransferase family 2 protein [Thalassotalea sp. Y01]|uniref:glycosyltransferase family 2 protein n=1 Tax=Thalassotalea sp. Y01 TaxID=2729613 RepID=UPI00145F027D|nr:glycosyltransferase family 2 protein [Thalassotalea sp. Y01]NMP16511.1 glycosyltransferase family 2 protein [Thalassotalea sp. Y01]